MLRRLANGGRGAVSASASCRRRDAAADRRGTRRVRDRRGRPVHGRGPGGRDPAKRGPPVRTVAVAVAGPCPGAAAVIRRDRAPRKCAGAARRLTDREFRQPPLFLLPFDPRELRANQRPVNRTLVDFDRFVLRLADGAAAFASGASGGTGAGIAAAAGLANVGCGAASTTGSTAASAESASASLTASTGSLATPSAAAPSAATPSAARDRRSRGREPLPSPACRPALPCRARPAFPSCAASGRLPAFVRVLRVARRAAGLLDVFFDHRDDRVVGHAPLARTVVVQNVTETQRALLH